VLVDASPCRGTWSPFEPPQNITSVNINNGQAQPAVSADELELYFESMSDLYVARRQDRASSFEPPALLTVLNTTMREVGPSPSADGTMIVFDSGRFADVDLFVAARHGSTFDPPTAIPGLSTAGADEETPTLSYDGSLVVYAVAQPTNADEDLFLAHGPASETPYAIIGKVPNVNQPGSIETSPSLSADGLELFFQTDRSGSRNKIYVSRRPSASSDFGPPTVVAELDNGADDTAPTISASGANLYFGSTRAGASGSTLWVATRTCQ